MTMIFGLIPARGGSKDIPHKNIIPVAGKPLIAWTITSARQSTSLSRLLVSTDDGEIAEVARRWGAEVPFMRPEELATDATPTLDVVVHAINWLREHDSHVYDYVLTLQPTSPLRQVEDIEEAVRLAVQHDADAIVSVTPLESHPYLAKQITDTGIIKDFISSGMAYLRRQDLPPAYALNGAIYLNRCESILRDRTMFPEHTYAYIMPPDRSLDVDTLWDRYLAELILKERRNID